MTASENEAHSTQDVEMRAQIESLKTRRARLTSVLERIAFDNDPDNGPIGLRIIAMTEADR